MTEQDRDWMERYTPFAEKPARGNSLGAAGADRGYVGAVQRYDGGVKGTG